MGEPFAARRQVLEELEVDETCVFGRRERQAPVSTR